MTAHHKPCHVSIDQLLRGKHVIPQVVATPRTTNYHGNQVSQRMTQVNIRLV